jgi:glycosyltransferase involved in cell wall biosynthesis
MNCSPKISVIIPTYNRRELLLRAVKSVLNQDFEHFDLTIVDDGSTDDTKEALDTILKTHPRRDKVFYYSIAKSGVSAARNYGIKKTSSRWLAFLDSDDEWMQNKLTKQWHYLQNNPNCKIVHGDEIWIRRGRRVNPKNIHKKSGGLIYKRCLELCLISPSAVVIRRDLLEEMGGFDEEFIVCEDYDLWLKITSQIPVGFIEKPIIIKYGGHEDQLSAKYHSMDYFRVKSMWRILKTGNLSEDYYLATIKEIEKKGTILVNGYKKHNNLENLDEIKSILEEVSKLMTK